MDTLIGLKDLRERMGHYERLIKTGRSFVVMKHSRPIFTISPVDEEWETVVDFTKFRKRGISANELLAKLKT